MFEMYECSKRLARLSDMAKKQIQPFAPDEQHYGQEVMQALERLEDVIHVRKYPGSSDKYFWPKGSYPVQLMYSYDINSTNAMGALQVHTMASLCNTQTMVTNLSFNEALARLRKRVKRHDMFKGLQESIIQDIAWFERIDSNWREHCQKIRDILGLLGELVRVINRGPDWVQICENRGWDSKKLIGHNDLSSVASMLTQKITTKGVTRVSLQDLLTKIDNIEKAKYFFNQIYECVMPAVYHLQELAHEEQKISIADLLTAHVTRIVDALLRLHEAINKTYRNINNSEYYTFASIDELLDAKIDNTMSLREAILFSQDGLVGTNILLRRISDTLENLHKNTINFVRPLGQRYTMYDKMQTSLVVAKTLCRLVECGDLAQIRAMEPHSYNIDLLIDLPVQLQASTLYKDAMYACTCPLSVYAGIYNALILAVLYRHTEIVQYFLSQGANRNIKGGRFQDLSAEDAVALAIPGIIKPASPELKRLLPGKIIRGNFGRNESFYKPVDFNNPFGKASETGKALTSEELNETSGKAGETGKALTSEELNETSNKNNKCAIC